MIFFYQSEITSEAVTSLVKLIEECEDDDIIIYFSSPGGDTIMADILINYINNSDRNIKIIAYWQISSVALHILLELSCDIEILDGVWGVVHLATRDVDMREMLSKDSLERFLREEADGWSKKNVIDRYSKYLKPAEIKRLKRGGDVLLKPDRFKELFNGIRG